MAARKSTAVMPVNRGLFLDRPPEQVPKGGLSDTLNTRIVNGRISNLQLGWTRFGSFQLNGPVRLISNYIQRNGTEFLIFATPTDLYKYVSATEVAFITPIYNTGTVDATAADPSTVTGTGTDWTNDGIVPGMFIAFGADDEDDPEADWYEILTVTGADSLTIDGNPGALTGVDYTIRRVFTGTALTHWDQTTFLNDANGDDSWFATNGIEPVVKWLGAGFADYAPFNITVIAKHLAVTNNMLVLGNITVDNNEFPTSIANSSPGDPEDFTTGLAGQFQVHEGSDPINDMVPLGDNLVIYSERHGTLAQFVGEPVTWAFRRAFTGIGPWGTRVVADYGDYHEFLGADAQYAFDGASLEEIHNHIWRVVMALRDPVRSNLALFHFHEELGELTWAVPLNDDDGSGDSGSAEIGWNEHYLEDPGKGFPTPYTKRQFPFSATGYFKQQTGLTWDTLVGTWDDQDYRWSDQFFSSGYPLNLAGDDDGKVYTFSNAQNADGVAMASFARFGRVALGEQGARGLLSRVYPYARSPAGGSHALTVRTRLVENLGSDPFEIQEDPYDLDLPEEGHFVSPYRRARYVELEFGTEGPDEDWEFQGYDTEVREGGRR